MSHACRYCLSIFVLASMALLTASSAFAAVDKSPTTLAERRYQEMSPMGALAAGLARPADPENASPHGASLAFLPFSPQVIGSGDVIVHGAPAYGFQSETSIAANSAGSVLIAGYNDLRGFNSTPLSLSGVSRSTDGGATWTEFGSLPAPVGGQVYGDPDVKYDPVRNRFVYSSIYVRPSDGLQGMSVHVSNADGSVWTGPIEVTPAFVLGNSADKEFLDINPVTGRILLTWTMFGASTRIQRAYSDDGGTTWSGAVNLASGSLQGSVPRFLPGATDATSTAYVAWRVGTGGVRNIGVVRSTDGGVTWGAPVNILSANFAVEDQMPGVDRIHTFPSMAIDHVTGRVYVVYQANSATGQGDIALRTFVGAPAAGAAVIVSSNPGADRAQFYPSVTVDQTTHRVHVIWYDQDPSATGDLTELMHTYSDNQGASWSRPTPLFDRAFRAGYGNDTSQPNIGDYLQTVAVNGRLHSLAASTSVLSQFNEGQPFTSMLSPDTYYDQLADAKTIASLRLGAVSFTETCPAGVNGSLEPGETGAFTFPLENYVANPVSGPITYTNVVATLSTTTPDVAIAGGGHSYPDIAPLATAVNGAPFLVQLSPAFIPGSYVGLLLTVQTDQGSIQLTFELPTGAPGGSTVVLAENFDTVVPPALPAGWTSVVGGGGITPAWVTATTIPGGGVGSQMAFHANTAATLWHRLFSPVVAIPAVGGPNVPYVTLDFDVAYSTEDDPSKLVQAFDGLTLRITDMTAGATVRSVLAEAFAELLKTGAIDHFPKHLPRSNDPAYLEDMSVWAGYSGGIVHVAMKFPGAGIVGRTLQLRFEYTQDATAVCTDAGRPAPCGVGIDNIVLQLVPTVGTFAPQSTTTDLTSDVNPATAGSAVQLTASITPSAAGGTVEFFDGATSLGTAPVSGGTASLTTSSLAVGTHSLTAAYSGDACDASSVSRPYSQQIDPATAVGDVPVTEFAITGVSPMPVRDRCRIGFALPRDARVELRVLDVQGREVAMLARGVWAAGLHEVVWGGAAGDAPAGAGMYFVLFRAGESIDIRRVVVTR